MRQIPNMVVMAPKDENELRQMVFSAVEYNCPCSIRYPRGNACGVPIEEDVEILPLGKGEILQDKENATVAIIAVGSMVKEAMVASEKLSLENINCSVINARFIKPLDEELILNIVKK